METLGSRTVYTNPWMTVREDEVRRADGSEGIYGVIDKPTYALVIAVDGLGRMKLVEQLRYPVGARRWELPQGTAPDRAEVSPGQLAASELREETGLRAASWTHLGLLDVAPGMTSQRGHVYLATGLTLGRPQREIEEQDMRSAWWSRADVFDGIRAGTIRDAQSVAALTLLLLHEGVC